MHFASGTGLKVSIGDITLPDFEVEMRMEYRLGRRIEEGRQGDDILLEGRKSFEFTLMGKLGMEQLKLLQKEVMKHQPVFRSEYGEFKVAVKSIIYRSNTGQVAIELVEDVD